MKILKNIIVGIIVITIAVITTFVLRTHFFKFDKKLTGEQKTIIEEYISNLDVSRFEENMTFMSTHYFGNRYNDDKLEVYLWVRFSDYDTTNGKFEEGSGYSIPYVVVVNTKDDAFEIISHQIPKDGSEYKKSINDMFPLAIRSVVLHFDETKEYKKLLDEHDELVQIYKNYLEETK